MRKIWILVVFVSCLIGCGTQVQPTITPAPTQSTQVTPTNPDWSVRHGQSMGLLKWNVTVTNAGQKPSTRLVIDCVDKNGKIVAEDDVACIVEPGKTVTKSGAFDVPEEEILKIAQIRTELVTDIK